MRQVWRQLKAIGTPATIVAAGVLLVQLFLGFDFVAERSTVIATHALYLIALGYLLFLLSEKPTEISLPSPKIIQVRDDGLVLTQNREWLAVGTLVAMYVSENGFEILVCRGEVINIQNDNLAQMATEGVVDGHIDKLKTAMKSVIIKPGVKL